MPIKLIIFDLDGVLCDTRPLHYEALNAALAAVDPKFQIAEEEHASTYDGLPTSVKLGMLSKTRQLPVSSHAAIWQRKQASTLELIQTQLPRNLLLPGLLTKLRVLGYRLFVASNSVRETLDAILRELGVIHFFEKTFAATDVSRPKPHPEIYLQCVLAAGLSPTEVMICEDSPIGRRAALESGCHLCPVEHPSALTWEFLSEYLTYYDHHMPPNPTPWIQKELNVVIPMAGLGSRFAAAGYPVIKPLINVRGKPMIQRVVENLNIIGKHIFICQQEHMKQYHLEMLLPWFAENPCIVPVEGLTEGAAATVLQATPYIDNDQPLFLANSDQWVDFSMPEFMYRMQSPKIDAGIVVFEPADKSPKWSYAKVDEHGWVTEVAEKRPISGLATVGFYYWKRGADFVKYAKQMMKKEIRINNEFYVCPVFNEAIADGKKIAIYKCRQMWGLGTPEDLETYLKTQAP